jgi:CRISPR-associated protein Cas2
MPMTMVVTRNVSDRMRGFLASSMLELSAGIYSAPRLSAGVRERIWAVVREWWPYEHEASLIMVWSDGEVPCGQAVETLGMPPIELVEADGIVLARRPA